MDDFLTNNDLKDSIINLGGVCDSYQELEREYELMPKVLKVLIRHEQPIIITTKSDLIIRDLDLIEELSNKAEYVNIALTITNTKDDVTAKLEPNTSIPENRFKALKLLKGKSMYTALHFMPILPCFSDDKVSLEQITGWAAEAEVNYMLSGMLYLTKSIKQRYYDFLKENYPVYLKEYQKLYKGGGADKKYKARVHDYLAEMRNKYNINNSYAKFLPKNRNR